MDRGGLTSIAFTDSGALGLDFGTTNSAAARVEHDRPALAVFDSSAGVTSTFPSILYFERIRQNAATRLISSAGAAAIDRYLHAEERGRLIQSLKAFLADRRFEATSVFSRTYSLEAMIALVVHHLLIWREPRVWTAAAEGHCGSARAFLQCA